MPILTIGHWNHSRDALTDLLRRESVDVIADVRSFPGSRRSPQFNQENLEVWLPERGFDYIPIKNLGGRRKNKDVDAGINAGWQNKSFRNYADYTLTDDFKDGMRSLLEIAGWSNVAIMCGEPMPWRCHRSLISNVLVARGEPVTHILPTKTIEHTFGQWGATPVVQDGRVTYPMRQMTIEEIA